MNILNVLQYYRINIYRGRYRFYSLENIVWYDLEYAPSLPNNLCISPFNLIHIINSEAPLLVGTTTAKNTASKKPMASNMKIQTSKASNEKEIWKDKIDNHLKLIFLLIDA